jgi:cytochrome c biogenesis protein CcdA
VLVKPACDDPCRVCIAQEKGRPMLADAVLAVHCAIVIFITAGLPLIWMGAALRWSWIRIRWLRALHLGAIGFVALESLVGIACPLTVWEAFLRQRHPPDGFVQQWLERALYHDLPAWVFTLGYTAFAVAVAVTWRAVPPRPTYPSA